jgi:hypothetical protein
MAETRWVLVARAEAGWQSDEATPPRSAVLSCPLCARAVRAFARRLRKPEVREVFACPGCGALVEEVPWHDEVVALPGASVGKLRAAVEQALMEAERWRCQADGARQRKDLAWADQAVAWACGAEQRIAAFQAQAARMAPRATEEPLSEES